MSTILRMEHANAIAAIANRRDEEIGIAQAASQRAKALSESIAVLIEDFVVLYNLEPGKYVLAQEGQQLVLKSIEENSE